MECAAACWTAQVTGFASFRNTINMGVCSRRHSTFMRIRRILYCDYAISGSITRMSVRLQHLDSRFVCASGWSPKCPHVRPLFSYRLLWACANTCALRMSSPCPSVLGYPIRPILPLALRWPACRILHITCSLCQGQTTRPPCPALRSTRFRTQDTGTLLPLSRLFTVFRHGSIRIPIPVNRLKYRRLISPATHPYNQPHHRHHVR